MDLDIPTQKKREEKLIDYLSQFFSTRRRMQTNIGFWIKECREELGMTHAELSAASSADIQQLIEAEEGIYTLTTADLESVMSAFRRQEKKGEAK